MPDTSMEVGQPPRSDMHVARLLASICIFLYLGIFAILFFLGSTNGTSLEDMLALRGSETSDVTEYIHLAENMLNVGRFEISPEIGPEFLRVPGYPAFLALVLVIFHTLTVVPLIQIIFTAGTVALIYLIGARCFPRIVAIAAATVYTLDPVVMYSTWVPISEPLFMFFFLASVYAIGTQGKRWWTPYIIAGVLFGISIYMRPVGLYLAPIVACFAFARAISWRDALWGAVIFLIAVFCVAAPWMARNYILADHFSFSSGGAYNLYAANMPIFEQARTGVSYQQIQSEYNERYFGIQEEDILRSFKYADKQAAIAKEVLLAHPFQYLIFHSAKSMQLFVGSSIVNAKYHLYKLGISPGARPQGEGAWGMLLQHHWRDAFVQTFTHIPRLIERLLWLIVYGGMLFTTFLVIRHRTTSTIWIICAFLLIHAIAFMTGPSSDTTRYRMPFEPFLLLLGFFGLYTALPRIKDWLLERPFVYDTWQWLVGTPRARRHLATRYMDFPDNYRILDIGCGTGELIDYLPTKIQYTGLDHNNDYIESAKKRYGHRGNFICKDIHSLDELHLKGGEYDVIILYGVLHHLSDVEISQMLASAKKLLKQGGHVLTVDGVYLQQQSVMARYILSKDRGQYVRFDHHYKKIGGMVFSKVETVVEKNILRIPTDYIVMKMFK